MQLSHKVLTISSICFFGSILFFFVGFPVMFKYIVKFQTSLRHGNLVRKFYLKLPISLDFKIYFFNVSNPDEVQAGAKPILKEIGPYCYDAFKEKIDVVDNKTEDSLTYTPYETYFFNEECSGSLTPDDYVTILNPLTVSIVAAVVESQPALLSTANKAINSIFKNPTSIYTTVKVRDILFEGIPIDCSVKDFPSKAVCSQLRAQIPSLKEREPKVYLFSVFGGRNGTLPNRVKVSRGTKNSKDVGKLLEVNDHTKLNIWTTEECNEYRGTDGWIFPPFIDDSEPIWSFSPDLCRSVHMDYKEDLKDKGLPLKRFEANLGDQSKNAEDKCYCPAEDRCLPKGVFDLTKCMTVPIYASLPHFYEADEMFLSQVDGLSPDKEKHALFANFETILAVPIEARKRMQLNLEVMPVEKVDFMKTVPKALHPIFWMEEGVVLKGDLLRTVKSIYIMLLIKNVFQYLILLGSLGGIGAGVYLYLKNRKVATITPISNVIKSFNNKDNNDINLSARGGEKEKEVINNNK